MKFISMLITILSLANSSIAYSKKMTCKEFDKASSQGFEVTFTDKQARIELKGKLVSSLKLVKRVKAPCCDQISTAKYSDSMVNGYNLTVKSGGFMGKTTAEIFHGGVVGYTSVAILRDCR